ncbi:MAG: LysM peptidoglycan-binding domain-containing protein, partial [Actinomycetota bacterium]|nr:LysM peptidoglycan-binding domain-containing protein [Actinomycetota bacterium]
PGGTPVEIKPSTYLVVTTGPAGVTTTPGAPAGEPGDTSAAEQSYVVQRGDFLSGIAADFGVEMDAIAKFNNWADGTAHPLFPEDTVRIPPGAKIPSAESDEETDTTEEDSGSSNDDEADETDTTEADDELCPDGERQGHYTIKAGDIPARVASSLDVTVDQLNDANASTRGYTAFIVGVEINIPCGGDLEAADTTEA